MPGGVGVAVELAVVLTAALMMGMVWLVLAWVWPTMDPNYEVRRY